MKQKDSDWERKEAAAQAKHGRPPRSLIDELWHHEATVRGTQYPPLLRGLLERLAAEAPEHFEWENYHDLKGLIDDFEKSDRAAWDEYALTQALHPRAEGLPEEVKSRGCMKRGPNKKCQQRRLRLLSFVADRYITKSNVFERHLDFEQRIDWKRRVAPEWNDAYPHDRRSTDDLRVRYYEARREPYLRELYFDRLYQQMVEPILTPLAAGVVALAEELRSTTPEHHKLMRRIFEEQPKTWANLVEGLITKHNDHVGARLQAAGIVSTWPLVDRQFPGRTSGSVWRRALRQPLGEKLKFRALRKDIAEVKRFAGRGWAAVSLAPNPYWVPNIPEQRNARRPRR